MINWDEDLYLPKLSEFVTVLVHFSISKFLVDESAAVAVKVEKGHLQFLKEIVESFDTFRV
jgi:hypothetical protein